MKATNDEFETITNQLNDWNAQILVLALVQELTETLATKIVRENRKLWANYLESIKHLENLEQHRFGMYT